MMQSQFETFDCLGAPVVVLDADQKIVHWNRASSELTGYALEEVRGRGVAEFLLAAGEAEPVRSVLAEVRADERPRRVASYWVTRTGERRWIEWAVTATKTPDERSRYVITTGIDQTERKEREQDAEAAQQELREVAEFREMFIAVVGHDLRNPLGAIGMATNLLIRRGNLDPQAAKQVGRIAKSSQRMARMISQLLDLTRARLGGGFPLEPKAIDLRDVCRGVAEEFGAAVDVVTEGDLKGTWDPDRLAEALSNIVGNALEYATPGTTVVVNAYREGAEVVVEIINRGDPIPADVLPSIFEPFRRGKRHEASARGNLGLGLYIAKQIVDSSSGSLVASSAGGFTTFAMRVPRNLPAGPGAVAVAVASGEQERMSEARQLG